MRLLLDTHIALWSIEGNRRLPNQARDLIADEDNTSFVSAISLWEIGIKHAIIRNNDRQIDISAVRALAAFTAAGFTLLAIMPEHAATIDGLPPLHGDPFDRLLVAQALSEPLRLVTHDAKVAAYSDTVILV